MRRRQVAGLPPTAPAAVLGFATSAFGQASGTARDWQIGRSPDLGAPASVLGLDPDTVSAAEVKALAARGILTVCYVSVGTVEDWRADAADFPAEAVGRPYTGWPGERFLDIRRRDLLLPLIEARFRRCAEAGFGAVEPDNIDLHINDTGFSIAADDVVAYVRDLARVAHALGLRIAQKKRARPGPCPGVRDGLRHHRELLR